MVTSFLSRVYGKIIKYRNKRYDLEKSKIVRINLPVISVGNLSVGGTGKTPFVQALARDLIAMKRKPAIIGRGYKRDSKGEIIVCDGKKTLVDAETGGDEMVLLADTLKIPVIAHDVKSKAAVTIERKFDVDCLIVDDGFQHRALGRNLDVVLIDKETIDKPYLLPHGRLREPLESLKRADVVCLTGGAVMSEKLKQVANPMAIFIKVKAYQGEPYFLEERVRIPESEIRLAKAAIVPVSGIAKPGRFVEMLKDAGYKATTILNFPDHHKYDRNDFEKIKRYCDDHKIKYIATTEKDAVKLKFFKDRFEKAEIKVLVFPVNLKITEGYKEFQNRLKLALGDNR